MFRVERIRAGSISRLIAIALAGGIALAPPLCRGVDENISQMQAAAAKGFIPQEIELAAAYYAGRGVTRDEKMAAYWYEKAARNGDPEAENEIGYFYQTGTGVTRDMARALHWYQLSAASGYTNAKVNLGVLYQRGTGVEKNAEMAMRLFQEAAAKGNGAAAAYLGDMYYFGSGVKQDRTEAEKWYAEGVRMRDPVAAYDLATLYSVKEDHAHDLLKAVSLLHVSAAAGYVPAMHSLGLILVQHPELAGSAGEARSLLEAASNAGSWRSTVVLGLLARDGKGVPADPAAAYFEFEAAISQGGDEARRLVANDLAALAAKLPQERTAELAVSAESWSREHARVLSFLENAGANSKRFPALPRAIADDGASSAHPDPPPS